MTEQFPILRKEHPSGSSLEYAPLRGGMVTSLILGGREVFYFDRATFDDPKMSVRGGVPILFPNAGELASEMYPGLLRHGFARNAQWKAEETESGFKESFSSGSETRNLFPFDFLLEFEGELTGLNSARFTERVRNTGTTPLPLAMGLHPYFKVPASKKKEMRFLFPEGNEIERRAEEWMSGGTVSVPNPGRIEVHIPGEARFVLSSSPEYGRLWVWSEEGKDFVCIEPVMRDPGGIVSDPRMVLPGESISLHFEIQASD